jgi:hypothetical protein
MSEEEKKVTLALREEYWVTADGRRIPVAELEPEYMRAILRMLLSNFRLKRMLRKEAESGTPTRDRVAALLRTKMAIIQSEPIDDYNGCEDNNGGPL